MSKLFADILITASDHSALKTALDIVKNRIDNEDTLLYKHDDFDINYDIYNQEDLNTFDVSKESLIESRIKENGNVNVNDAIWNVEGVELNKTMCIQCLSSYIHHKNVAADFPDYLKKFIQDFNNFLDEEDEEDEE
jgi:hypothetical protein